MKRWIAIIMAVFGVGFLIGMVAVQPKDKKLPLKVEKILNIKGPTPTTQVTTITIIGVGDVMLGRSVQEQMVKKNDWTWPFLKTADYLKQADITLGNLEAPVVPNCTQDTNRMRLCMDPKALAGLTLADFKVMTLANNHMLNYGQEGLKETQTQLKTLGIRGSYNGQLVMKEVGGIKIGVMGLDDVTRPLDLVETRAQVASASGQVDALVVMVHWGNEYIASPSARQREVAQTLSGGGADIILGSHPHWVQPVEKVGKTTVFWSLGNFVFDQMWSEETRRGAMAKIRLQMTDHGLQNISYDLVPIKIEEYGQPRIATSD